MKKYSPLELLLKYRETRDAVGLRDLYNCPKHKKTQEIWCAAKFGLAYSYTVNNCLLVVADEDEQTIVDFCLELAGTKYPFQITEVITYGRRRGDEYKAEKIKPATLKDWDDGAKYGSQWIKEAIEKKYNRYARDVSKLNLLVYINFLAEEINYEEVRLESYYIANQFSSVWLLDGDNIFCLAGKIL